MYIYHIAMQAKLVKKKPLYNPVSLLYKTSWFRLSDREAIFFLLVYYTGLVFPYSLGLHCLFT